MLLVLGRWTFYTSKYVGVRAVWPQRMNKVVVLTVRFVLTEMPEGTSGWKWNWRPLKWLLKWKEMCIIHVFLQPCICDLRWFYQPAVWRWGTGEERSKFCVFLFVLEIGIPAVSTLSSLGTHQYIWSAGLETKCFGATKAPTFLQGETCRYADRCV